MSGKFKGRLTSRRRRVRGGLARTLRLQMLESRQLMAVNVLDDVLSIGGSTAINVLTNDTSGNLAQTVSAFQADFDRNTYDPGVNATDWFIPERPGQPGVPQRSLIVGGITSESGNRGDLDLYRDTDTDPSNDDNTLPRLVATEGVVLATVRDNSPVDETKVNLATLQYVVDDASTWIAMSGAPENITGGEQSVPISTAFFPHDAGWQAGSFAENLSVIGGGAGLTVTGGGALYTVAVDGVTNSYEDGYLFSMAGDNSDNYSRVRPIGGNQWDVRVRDNAGAQTSSDPDPISVIYIPRSAQGLIGGVVNAGSAIPNAMRHSYGDFSIQRESDGFWRLSVPGHDVTSGVLVIESVDETAPEPRNAYFTYDAATDNSGDIIIRQFEWTSTDIETPLNTDFVFFFIPFENTLAPASDLSIVDLGTAGDPTSGLSDKGIALSLNADGTVAYDAAGAIRALGAGESDVDSFVYTATDGVDTATATATINWVGVNDAPEVLLTPGDMLFNEDDASQTLDLSTIFSDVDATDTLTYTVESLGEVISTSLSGSNLEITPNANAFGFTLVTVTATDPLGLQVSVTFGVSVLPQADDVVAVDDTALTDKVTPVNVPVLANDYHPDTTIYSVSAAEIFGNSNATGNGDTIWNVVNGTASPNNLTIQSAANLGDVAVGRGGLDLSLADGVLLGTVRENVFPYQTVDTYNAFGSYGFATDSGVGGGERNSPLSAAFFPFAEGWTGGHVAADGSLLGGVGVTSADVVKLGTGLFQVTIPEATIAAQDGFLFVMSGSNDDNIISVIPSEFDNTWTIRQMDSDSDINGFEDDAISFVYIPGTTTGLIGGRAAAEEGQRNLVQSYGGVSMTDNFDHLTLSIPGYTAADGALIALANGEVFADIGGTPTLVPANHAVLATPDGNDFRIDILQSFDYLTVNDIGKFQFIFLPYDSPLERYDGLEFSVTSFDGTSALGAAVTQNVDGTFNYDPSVAGEPISSLGNGQTLEDTFTYTITDGRGGASTATVTITVQGENQAPTANDDVINLNELSANGALLTVLGNDTDPDLFTILGTPEYTVTGNLSVDASSVWSVAGTGTSPNAISLGANSTGQVEVLRDGVAIAPADGVVMATVRENYDGAATNYRLVQAYANGTGGTTLALSSFGTDGAADAPVSLAYFPFADGWIGGHVNSGGVLTSGNGLTAGEVVRTGTGRYEVSIPGVTDAAVDGFLFVIGNENADNVVSTRAVPGSSLYQVAVRDNGQDFGNGEDGGFSFVFVPRNAANLVAGTVDTSVNGPNAVSLGIGEYSIERRDVDATTQEWKLTIPGQTPDSGVLVLTNQDNTEIEDNYLSYQDDGAGSFIIRSHDLPGMGRQGQPFTFAFIPFDGPGLPTPRPVMDPLSILSIDAASSLGVTLSFNADNTINYQPGTMFDSLYDGDSAIDSFSYTMTDGFGGQSTATVTINIFGFGAAPILTTSVGATYYALGDQPIGIDANVDYTAVGQALLDGAVATIEITSGGLATDILSIRNEGVGAGQIGVSGSELTYEGTVVGALAGGANGTPLTVTFNGAASATAVDLALRAVSFSNVDSATPLGVRQVTFGFVDQYGKISTPVTKDLTLGLIRRRDLQQGVDNGYGSYQSAADAQIREAQPDVVLNPASDFLIDFDTAGANSQALLKFGNLFGDGPGQIPADAIITSATLVVETAASTANASGDGATLHRMLTDWDAETATWNTLGSGIQKNDVEARAEFDSAIGTASGAAATGTGFLSFSVLPDVRAWAAGETNYGWGIIGWDGNTDGWFFSSSEDPLPNTRPRLQIEWVPAGTNVASFREGVSGYAGTVDTQIVSSSPDAEYSTVETLFVDDPTNQVLVRFDGIIGETLGQIPTGSKIVSARLRTASTTADAQGDGGRFYPILTTWNESDSFNALGGFLDADGVDAEATYTAFAGDASRSPDVQGGWHDWDVTADVQAWVSGARANLGWAITPWVSGTNGWGFQSSEAPIERERPQLEVFYVEGTNAPPTEVLLDNSEVAENTDTTGGLFVGNLSAADPDFGDVHTFALVAGAGDTDNGLFTISGNQLVLNDGVMLDFENKSSYAIRVQAKDLAQETVETELVINVIDRGEVETIVVGDGTNSRSRVDQVTVTFDSEVTVNAGAFEVLKRGVGGGAVTVDVTTDVVGGKTVATLVFSGSFTQSGSLVDGNYQLSIIGANITDALGNAFDGDKDGVVGGDDAFGDEAVDRFFRFYGDTDGDRDVDFSDFLRFRGAYPSALGDAKYRADLDFAADGQINFADFLQFRSRYGGNQSFE